MPKKISAKKTVTVKTKSVILKEVDPVSTGKIYGVIFAIFGFIVGIAMTAFSAVIGFPYGAVSIVILPIMYGIGGFILGAIGAIIYNVIASRIGGIKLEFE